MKGNHRFKGRPGASHRGEGARPQRGASGPGRSAGHSVLKPRQWSPRGEAEVVGRPPVRIWQGVPGEKAEVRIVHRGQNQVLANWVRAERPHPRRIEPPCDRYSPCGGCPLMHLDARGQRDAREDLVKRALGSVDLSVPIEAFHGAPEGDVDYRHVVKLGIGRSGRGRVKVGAWGRRDRRIVPIPECRVAAPVLRRTMAALAHHILDLDIAPYDPEADRGVLRSAVLRASRASGEVLITLVAGRRTKDLGELAERVAADATEVVGVWLHINQAPGNAIFERGEDGAVGVRPLLGKDTLQERLGGIAYHIGPGDFFQTHPAMAEVLYERVLSRLALSEGEPVVDLYSGVGGLALPAARRTGWALGVEGLEGAVQRAREAARRQAVPAEFLAGDVQQVLPDLTRRLARNHPVVTVNPARRGLEPGVIEGIVGLQPRRIAYVSCNPRALARDLRAFVDSGFEVAPLELFDMFPHTPHVETLAVLTPKEPVQATRRAPRRRVVRRHDRS